MTDYQLALKHPGLQRWLASFGTEPICLVGYDVSANLAETSVNKSEAGLGTALLAQGGGRAQGPTTGCVAAPWRSAHGLEHHTIRSGARRARTRRRHYSGHVQPELPVQLTKGKKKSASSHLPVLARQV